jgi:protein-S-isoprenylcysteine O-methyltransferase Ste14
MMWIRGLIFTILVPGVLIVLVPALMARGHHSSGWLLWAGWLVTGLGGVVYGSCILQFLLAGGTPAIFFTRRLRFLIGEEPAKLVELGLYKYSRNPMYLGALTLVAGQAMLYGSGRVAIYAVTIAIIFQLVVVFLEEPHLKRKGGESYTAFCARVPRWFGLPKV